MALFALTTLLFAPMFGTRFIPVANFFNLTGTDALLLWKIRVPRILLAFAAGSALAVSGLAFQALFKNALATPFTLGISSGASLGAAVFIRFGLAAGLLKSVGTSVFAFLGALLAVITVYGLTVVKKRMSTHTMLLAGVAVSFCFSSIILFLQYTADFEDSFQIIRWLMGGLEVAGYDSFYKIIPFVITGTAVIFKLNGELNIMTTGDDIAAVRGVDVKKTIELIFFFTSLMLAVVISVTGPIGFIGMMVPHICRLLIGMNHRYLVPATLFMGGSFLVICDTVARTLLAPVEIPVGVITSMIGGPFFLWLLLSEKK
jgi:iron complex transport system permease protein